MSRRIYLLISMGLIVFSALSPNASLGHTIYQTPKEFYTDSDLIVVGKILFYDDNGEERHYRLEVKEYVKKPSQFQDVKEIDVISCNPNPVPGTAVIMGCLTFEKGQSVFFGLDEKPDEQFFFAGGFVIQNQNCTGQQLLDAVNPVGDFRIIQNNKTTSKLFSGIKTDLAYNFSNQDLFSKNLTITFHVLRSSNGQENDTFSDTKHLLISDCTGHTVISTSFIPKKIGMYQICAEDDSKVTQCYGGVTVIDKISSPLKQLQTGLQPDEITCNEGLELVIKSEHRHQPMCVTPSTKLKLIQLGLALPIQIAGSTTMSVGK